MRLSRRMCSHGAAGDPGQTLSNLSPGDVLLLNETISGTTTAVPFLLVKDGHHATGYYTMCRLYLIGSTTSWGSSSYFTAYSASALNTKMVAYKAYLDADVQSALANCTIRVQTKSFQVGNLSRYVFALSATEMGLSGGVVEGSPISYFSSNNSRKATKAGESTIQVWWTRTAYVDSEIGGFNTPFYVDTTGAVTRGTLASNSRYYRPAFALDSDTLVSTTTDGNGYYSLI